MNLFLYRSFTTTVERILVSDATHWHCQIQNTHRVCLVSKQMEVRAGDRLIVGNYRIQRKTIMPHVVYNVRTDADHYTPSDLGTWTLLLLSIAFWIYAARESIVALEINFIVSIAGTFLMTAILIAIHALIYGLLFYLTTGLRLRRIARMRWPKG